MAIVFIAVAILAFNEFSELLPIVDSWKTLLNDLMWELLFIPALLLYFVTCLDHPLSVSNARYWLFLPFVATLLINVYLDLDHEFQIVDIGIAADSEAVGIYYQYETWFCIVYAVLGSAWTYIILSQNQSEKSTVWLKKFWLWTTAIVLLWLVVLTLFDFADTDIFSVLWLAVSTFFFWVSLKGVMQFKLAEERYEIRSKLDRAESERSPAIPSSNTVSFTQKPNVDYFLQLEHLMKRSGYFRDPNLSRESVADKLGISSGYLSKLVRAHTDDNFTNYINRYRIEEVKRLLSNPEFEHYSLLSIGYEAGFNSKTTYNNTFKRLTGQTPSQFKQSTPSEVL
ncbi:MAG: helix-turn-helix transcriptional regulator [Bacteroidota bacterium]